MAFATLTDRTAQHQLERGIRYVEALLKRPILSRLLPQEGPVSGIGIDSPLTEWDRLGQELRQRLSVILRLEEALGVLPSDTAPR